MRNKYISNNIDDKTKAKNSILLLQVERIINLFLSCLSFHRILHLCSLIECTLLFPKVLNELITNNIKNIERYDFHSFSRQLS